MIHTNSNDSCIACRPMLNHSKFQGFHWLPSHVGTRFEKNKSPILSHTFFVILGDELWSAYLPGHVKIVCFTSSSHACLCVFSGARVPKDTIKVIWPSITVEEYQTRPIGCRGPLWPRNKRLGGRRKERKGLVCTRKNNHSKAHHALQLQHAENISSGSCSSPGSAAFLFGFLC